MENLALKKIGNSRGYIIPKRILDSLGIEDDTKADLKTEIVGNKKRMIIEVEPEKKELTIEELFKNYKGGRFQTDLVDIGEPVGNEKW